VTATTAREANHFAEEWVQVDANAIIRNAKYDGAQLIDIVHQQPPNIVSIMLSAKVDYDHVIRC